MEGIASILNAPQPTPRTGAAVPGIRISDIVRGAAPDDVDLPFAFDDLHDLVWPDTPHGRKIAAAVAGMRPGGMPGGIDMAPEEDI
ncbi:hypothetical protein HDU93_006555, partial [Gonapodya sp. JEL0774]